MTNFLNNLFGLTENASVAGPGGDGVSGGNNGPGGIGNNRYNEYAQIGMVPGVPTVQPATVYAAGGSLHGRVPINYSGYMGIDIANLPRPIQGGHGDLYSFRVRAPAVPSRSMGINEIAYQIQRNNSSMDFINGAAPPVPTNGWLPPALSVPFEQ